MAFDTEYFPDISVPTTALPAECTSAVSRNNKEKTARMEFRV